LVILFTDNKLYGIDFERSEFHLMVSESQFLILNYFSESRLGFPDHIWKWCSCSFECQLSARSSLSAIFLAGKRGSVAKMCALLFR